MRPDEPVSRIMTETVVVIEADRPVSQARDCFGQHPIHHLPVVTKGKLVGMLSSADVMTLECFAPKGLTNPAAYLDERLTLTQLMRSPVLSLRAGRGVGEAAELMIGSGVHAAPIVDDEDHVVGIITTSDVIRCLLHGPPRKGTVPSLRTATQPPSDGAGDEPHYYRRPTDAEFATALGTADVLHVETRDPRHLGKALLYLAQREAYLAKVLELSDRFLLTGQDEHVHALLLKAIGAARRAEDHATGRARVPFPLD